MSELQVTPERSLRGGPRAARRAVAQLIRLGKSAQVCIYSYFYYFQIPMRILEKFICESK